MVVNTAQCTLVRTPLFQVCRTAHVLINTRIQTFRWICKALRIKIGITGGICMKAQALQRSYANISKFYCHLPNVSKCTAFIGIPKYIRVRKLECVFELISFSGIAGSYINYSKPHIVTIYKRSNFKSTTVYCQQWTSLARYSFYNNIN